LQKFVLKKKSVHIWVNQPNRSDWWPARFHWWWCVLFFCIQALLFYLIIRLLCIWNFR
jgi:hypothetical protein